MATRSFSSRYDAYAHNTDYLNIEGAGFTAATSGTAAGTVVNPGTADPTGTTTLTGAYGCSDSQGIILITTAGTQTTGALRTIYFQNPYPWVPTGVSVTVSTEAGAAAGGTITTTVTNTSLAISVGTALTTATKYVIRYTIQG